MLGRLALPTIREINRVDIERAALEKALLTGDQNAMQDFVDMDQLLQQGLETVEQSALVRALAELRFRALELLAGVKPYAASGYDVNEAVLDVLDGSQTAPYIEAQERVTKILKRNKIAV